MKQDPRAFKVVSDREGFYLEDDYGEDQTPTRRFKWFEDAKKHQTWMVIDYLDNYEPPETGDAWSGGFANNH